MTQPQSFDKIRTLVEGVNKKGVTVTEKTTFAVDLDLDSLTVMDLVADIEDEFDIILPINLLPELETVGDVAVAVDRIVAERDA